MIRSPQFGTLNHRRSAKHNDPGPVPASVTFGAKRTSNGRHSPQTWSKMTPSGPGTTSAFLPLWGDKWTLCDVGRLMPRRRHTPDRSKFFGYNHSEARRPDSRSNTGHLAGNRD